MYYIQRTAVLATAIFAVAALVIGTSPARAALDDELSIIDGNNRTLTIQQRDTVLNGVDSLDRNRLTREWFHSGRATYTVTGPDANQFSGSLELGYQVSFPWSLGVGINFSYTTPNILMDKSNITSPAFGLQKVITPNLFPGVSLKSNLGDGPGIQEVATSTVNVVGAGGTVAVSNAHGTVTGAAGGVMLRPFARLISKSGESVTTYGQPWDMN